MNDGSDSDSHPDDDSNYDGSSDEENNQNVANVDPESIAVAHRLIKSQPLKKALRKVKTKHRTPEQIRAFNAEIEEYLTTLFNLPYCFSRYQCRFVSCRCVQVAQQGYSFSFLAARLGKFLFF
jgi:hypothetical protein